MSEIHLGIGALRDLIRDVPDFPKPGILFKDITPMLGHGAALSAAIGLLAERVTALRADVIVAIESRGFIFGAPVAAKLGLGFVPVRKPGKLPWKSRRVEYALEYGTDALELHDDAIKPGQRVVIVDDLLATGGTARAVVQLIRQCDAVVAGACFLIELGFLDGRKALEGVAVEALITY